MSFCVWSHINKFWWIVWAQHLTVSFYLQVPELSIVRCSWTSVTSKLWRKEPSTASSFTMLIYYRRTIEICTLVPSSLDICQSQWINSSTGKRKISLHVYISLNAANMVVASMWLYLFCIHFASTLRFQITLRRSIRRRFRNVARTLPPRERL